MYQVEDEPIITTHLYVVREGPARPSIAPIVLSLVTLSLLIALGVATPYTQPVTRLAIRVPAVLLFVRSFSASVSITPTGVKSYPATYAHGTLSIRNGSVIAQTIPAGFVISGVAIDSSVFVPGATTDGDGMATVAAHVVAAGVNLPALTINEVIGSSLFIRNPSPFTGAHAAYSVKYITEQDKQVAIYQARNLVSSQISGFHYPCMEAITNARIVKITWRCQFITYHIPPYMHVSAVHLSGKNLVLAVWFIAPVKRIGVK